MLLSCMYKSIVCSKFHMENGMDNVSTDNRLGSLKSNYNTFLNQMTYRQQCGSFTACSTTIRVIISSRGRTKAVHYKEIGRHLGRRHCLHGQPQRDPVLH